MSAWPRGLGREAKRFECDSGVDALQMVIEESQQLARMVEARSPGAELRVKTNRPPWFHGPRISRLPGLRRVMKRLIAESG